MKKLSFLISMLVGLHGISQVIQNRNFENWTTDSVQCPVGYECSNINSFGRISVPTTEQTTAYSGNIGLKLKTQISGQDTVFGYILNGDMDNNSGGIAFSQRPDSVAGYYKSNIMPGDTGLIICNFRSGGQGLGMVMGQFMGVQSTFKRFSFAINYNGSGNPDSMIFAAASSNAMSQLGVAHNSELILDSIHFVGATQTIVNHDFEQWENFYRTTPDHWGTMLDHQGISKSDLVTRLTGTDAYEGKYAIRVKNAVEGKDTMRGIITNRKVPRDGNDFGGYAYTKQLDTLKGMYRFYSPQPDSGSVALRFWNSTQFEWIIQKLPPTSTYSSFEVPFNLTFQPDSIQITFTAGDYTSRTLYTDAYIDIDNLDFKICDKPNAPSAITGMDSLCRTASMNWYSVSSQTDASGFHWMLPKGMRITSTPMDSNAVEIALADSSESGNLMVSAQVYCGESASSSLAIYLDTMPSSPKIVRDENHPSKPDSVFYNAGVDAQSFEWYWKDGASYKKLAFSGRKLSFDNRTNVTIKVIAINGLCQSAADSLTVIPSSLNDLGLSNFISLYPNPARDVVSLHNASSSAIGEINLLDIQGKVVVQNKKPLEGNATLTISIEDLKPGLYFIVAQSTEGAIRKKLVVE